MKKQPTNIVLTADTKKAAKKEAKRQKISLSIFIEKLIKAALIGAIIFSMTHCAPERGCYATQGMSGYQTR
jgi:hypothetical protein